MEKRGELNKSGQFYIIAAVVIIIAVIGIVSVTNYVQTDKDSSVLDLSKELQLEGEEVVNYGIFQDKELDVLLNNFMQNYGNYVQGKDKEFLFIYADADLIKSNKVNVLYSFDVTNSLSLILGSDRVVLPIVTKTLANEEVDITGGTIKVNVGNSEQEFKLNEGQNFYFVIKQPIK